MNFDSAWIGERARPLIATEFSGKAVIPDVPFENPDGSPLKVDTDLFGKARDPQNPTPGPFEQPGNGI